MQITVCLRLLMVLRLSRFRLAMASEEITLQQVAELNVMMRVEGQNFRYVCVCQGMDVSFARPGTDACSGALHDAGILARARKGVPSMQFCYVRVGLFKDLRAPVRGKRTHLRLQVLHDLEENRERIRRMETKLDQLVGLMDTVVAELNRAGPVRSVPATLGPAEGAEGGGGANGNGSVYEFKPESGSVSGAPGGEGTGAQGESGQEANQGDSSEKEREREREGPGDSSIHTTAPQAAASPEEAARRVNFEEGLA